MWRWRCSSSRRWPSPTRPATATTTGTSRRSAGPTWRTRTARSTTERPPCVRRRRRPSGMPKTLGLVADPVVVAEAVERTGPGVAARLSGDWHVRTDEQTFAAGQELRELSQRAEALAEEHGWDAVIGLTDLPMV